MQKVEQPTLTLYSLEAKMMQKIMHGAAGLPLWPVWVPF